MDVVKDDMQRVGMSEDVRDRVRKRKVVCCEACSLLYLK